MYEARFTARTPRACPSRVRLTPAAVRGLLSACTLLGLLPAAQAQYNAAAQFSPTSNPTGTWSYGFSTSLGGTFTFFNNPFVYEGLNFWNGQPGGGNTNHQSPWVAYNGTASPITPSGNNFTLQPGDLALGPGPDFSIVRWTAPSSGSYTISGVFADPNVSTNPPATTDVHILLDGTTALFNGVNDGTTTSVASGNILVTLAAGDTIDFVSGNGGNGFENDHTRLTAAINNNAAAVPEPAPLTILGCGALALAGLVARARRKSMPAV